MNSNFIVDSLIIASLLFSCMNINNVSKGLKTWKENKKKLLLCTYHVSVSCLHIIALIIFIWEREGNKMIDSSKYFNNVRGIPEIEARITSTCWFLSSKWNILGLMSFINICSCLYMHCLCMYAYIVVPNISQIHVASAYKVKDLISRQKWWCMN